MCGSWACSKDAIGASLPSSLRQPAAVTPVTASVGSLALAELFEKSTLFFSSDSTFFTHNTRGEGEGCNLAPSASLSKNLGLPSQSEPFSRLQRRLDPANKSLFLPFFTSSFANSFLSFRLQPV